MTILTNKQLVTKQNLIGNTPVITCFNQGEDSLKPLVILSHGFRGSKIDLKDEMKMLANMNYYAVSIDNRGHGDRTEADFLGQVVQNGEINIYEVRRLIKETADDIPAIIDHFAKDKLVDAQRVGMCGVSMGGFITFRTLVFERRIKVAAPVIASPYWNEFPSDVPVVMTPEVKQKLSAYSQKYSPAHFPEQFYPRPILMQIAGKDNHYNGKNVQQFCRDLKKSYQDEGDRVKLIVHEDDEHIFTELMWTNVVQWLQEHL